MEVTRKTPEEITTLARQIVTNQVYAAWSPEQMDNSFGGFLMLVAGSSQEQGESIDWMNDVGLIYEDYAKANERSVNGYPSFFSAQYLHREDRLPLNRECIRMAVALGEVEQEVLDKFDEGMAAAAAAKTEEEGKPQ